MKFLQSAPGDEPVIVSGLFNAPVARLFKAWTDPEDLKKWFGPRPNTLIDVNLTLQVGKPWCFMLESSDEKHELLEGQYLEIEENAKLVFSWRHVKKFADGRCEATDYSKVIVVFTASGQSTHIDLRHEAIKSEDGRLGVGRGWQTCFEQITTLFQ